MKGMSVIHAKIQTVEDIYRLVRTAVAPAKLAEYIKGRSSRHLQAEFPELRKQYCGQHMWALGHFCATVGAVDGGRDQSLHQEPAMGRGRRIVHNHSAHQALSRLCSRASSGGLSRNATFSRSKILPAFRRQLSICN